MMNNSNQEMFVPSLVTRLRRYDSHFAKKNAQNILVYFKDPTSISSGDIRFINGNSRILKWRYVSTIFLAIFWGISPYIALKNRPYIW